MKIFDYFSKNIGIDLGTANSLMYLGGRGIVMNEPSVAAINNKTGQIVAIGEEAKKMIGRTPLHITVIRPLINGVISDFEMTEEILRFLFKKTIGSSNYFNYNKAVIGVPSNLTEVERKSVEDAVLGAGANKVYIIEEPLAAALGARMPIDEPTSNLIIDIGGGTTEIAVISMGGIVRAKSIKIAGDKFNNDIIKFIKDEFRLAIGEPSAEELKINIGSAIPLEQKMELAIRGRDMATGLPREVLVKDSFIRAAISKSLKIIIDSIKETIETTPPELVGDVLKRGIHICGGGSLLKGIDKLIEKEISVSANIIDDPLTCVARGSGMIVENLEKYSYLINNPLRPKDIKI
jgi:rod shape-determining protein MreB and related proteins